MTTPEDRTFAGDFKRFFLRGLVVLLPSVLTLWIVVKAYQFVDNNIAEPINTGIRYVLVKGAPWWEPLDKLTTPTVEEVDREFRLRLESGIVEPDREVVRSDLRMETFETYWRERWYLNIIGLVVAIIAVYIAGRLLGGFFGRRIYRRIEQFITTIPVFKQVYPYIKQIVDFLFSDDQPLKFNRVMACEYPRKGIWSVGFLTGETLKSVAAKAGDSVTMFIPSSPTPFTGYTITVPRADCIELPITVEEAIRFAVSGGVLVPEDEVVSRGADGLPILPDLGPEAQMRGLMPIPGTVEPEEVQRPPAPEKDSTMPERGDNMGGSSGGT